MGFKDYCKDEKLSNGIKEDLDDKTKDNIGKIYDKYKDKNEDELKEELFNTINKQKQDGTFNKDSLENTLNKISPFLTQEQNQKINEILKKI